MYDTVRTLQFEKVEEIEEFVNAASKCNFEIDIKCNRMFIDAKSILGVLGIGLGHDFLVCYGGDNADFENVVDKLAVA